MANRYQATNAVLHDWGSLNGILGISYCPYESNYDTSTAQLFVYCYLFQKLLGNLSSYSMFGLDLNEPTSPSYLHLGGINTSYQSSIQWALQPTMNLKMHEFLMKDLRLDCDFNNDDENTEYVNSYGNSKNLLSRYGSTWPAGNFILGYLFYVDIWMIAFCICLALYSYV